MRACCLIREQPHYRRQAFVTGLQRVGYSVGGDTNAELLVIWNRYGKYDRIAKSFEAQRKPVIVAENGYIGADKNGVQMYALALNGHNGSGTWPIGDGDRWQKMGLEFKPWRQSGDHIVICVQRGIGAPGMASPPDWHIRTAARLKTLTKRPIVIRPHGGHPACSPKTVPDMQQKLADCHAAVVWTSANGVRALFEGVPVIYQGPHWIASGAASRGLEGIENPPMPDRLPAFQRLAWAQWTVAEIASGDPFRLLLDKYQKRAA